MPSPDGEPPASLYAILFACRKLCGFMGPTAGLATSCGRSSPLSSPSVHSYELVHWGPLPSSASLPSLSLYYFVPRCCFSRPLLGLSSLLLPLRVLSSLICRLLADTAPQRHEAAANCSAAAEATAPPGPPQGRVSPEHAGPQGEHSTERF